MINQMFSMGEETEVVPYTFEEATIIGSRWMYKTDAKNSIRQPRLVPTTLECPSPSRRGTVISASEKSTSGNEPVSMGMPNTDDRGIGRKADDGKRSTGTDEIKNGAMDHEKGRDDEGGPQEGELRSGQRRDEVRQKLGSGLLFAFFSMYLVRRVLWNPPCDRKTVEKPTPHVDDVNRSLPPKYLTYAYCSSKLDFVLRVG